MDAKDIARLNGVTGGYFFREAVRPLRLNPPVSEASSQAAAASTATTFPAMR